MTYVCTIFADASLDQRSRVAAWGVWMKGRGKASLVRGGEFKSPMRTSTDAEFTAIANALSIAKANGYLAPGYVMIQCDNTMALSILHLTVPGTSDNPKGDGLPVHIPKRTRARGNLLQDVAAPVKAIMDIVGEFQLNLVTRHVRGHTSGHGRQWVNREVDAIAKAAMRRARKAMKASTA